MGLPEVEVSPIHLIKGLTLGQCRLPKGGQCHQCGTKEEGNGGCGNRDHPEAELSLMGFIVLVLRPPFPLVKSAAFCCETGLYMPSFNIRAWNEVGTSCCSVAKSCLSLWDPIDCSTPSFPILHYLPEFVQMPIELVILSNHLVLCYPPLLLPSVFPSIRVFSIDSFLCIRWPKYWSFNFTISPSREYSGQKRKKWWKNKRL